MINMAAYMDVVRYVESLLWLGMDRDLTAREQMEFEDCWDFTTVFEENL